MVDMEDLKERMVVYSSDGRRLGRITSRSSSMFQVESGIFNRRDFLVHLSDVERVAGRAVLLWRTKRELRGGGGYKDYGYADRGHAGDPRPQPISGIGAGLAPAAPPADIGAPPPKRETGAPRYAEADPGPWTTPLMEDREDADPELRPSPYAGVHPPSTVPRSWGAAEAGEPEVPRDRPDETDPSGIRAPPPKDAFER